MMMFKIRKQKSFRRRIGEVRNLIVFSVCIFGLGYFLNMGFHTNIILTIAIVLVGLVFLCVFCPVGGFTGGIR